MLIWIVSHGLQTVRALQSEVQEWSKYFNLSADCQSSDHAGILSKMSCEGAVVARSGPLLTVQNLPLSRIRVDKGWPQQGGGWNNTQRFICQLWSSYCTESTTSNVSKPIILDYVKTGGGVLSSCDS